VPQRSPLSHCDTWKSPPRFWIVTDEWTDIRKAELVHVEASRHVGPDFTFRSDCTWLPMFQNGNIFLPLLWSLSIEKVYEMSQTDEGFFFFRTKSDSIYVSRIKHQKSGAFFCLREEERIAVLHSSTAELQNTNWNKIVGFFCRTWKLVVQGCW